MAMWAMVLTYHWADRKVTHFKIRIFSVERLEDSELERSVGGTTKTAILNQ